MTPQSTNTSRWLRPLPETRIDPDARVWWRESAGQLALIAATIAAVAAADGWLPAPARVAALLGFLGLCPGLAIVRLLRLSDPIAHYTLAVALSWTLATLGSLVSVYGGVWSPHDLLFVLAGITVAAVGTEAGLRHASELRRVAGRFRREGAPMPIELTTRRRLLAKSAIAAIPVGRVMAPIVVLASDSAEHPAAEAPHWTIELDDFADPYDGALTRPKEPDPASRYLAANVSLFNGSDAPLAFDPADLRVRAFDGTEYPAGGATGADPKLSAQNLPGGDRARGWVWFVVPKDARISEVRYYAPRPVLRIPLMESVATPDAEAEEGDPPASAAPPAVG